MTTQLSRSARVDARENRERIAAVAREAFRSDGLGVPMRTVATRAGVSPATLYRHFPSKQDLATEAFDQEMRACEAVLDQGLADADPWRGFCRFVELICDLHLENGGFTAAFTQAYPGVVDVNTARARSLRSLAVLMDRAKATGRLRSDFALGDVVLILNAHRGVRVGRAEMRRAASRRFATLAIQAFSATAVPS